jgi:hypothetical protein
MAETAHARYRARLAALADDHVVPGAIGNAAAGLAPRDGWVRTYGRFTPDQEPFATLVLEAGAPQTIVRVEAFATCPPGDSPDAVCARDAALGWIRVSPFPSDPGLPTLPAVLSARPSATVVRYRPGRRCTIRFDENESSRFAKVFPDDDGEGIHATTVALWRAAASGGLDFAVAMPDRWDPATRTLWQGTVPGAPIVERLCGAEGATLVRRMGRVLASLNGAGLEPPRTFDGPAQLVRSVDYGEELVRRVPGTAEDVDTLIATLTAAHAASGGRPLRPIHGAPHAHQWLDDGARLGLVDFDRMAQGDPELDVATFLGELDFETDLAIPVDRLAREFVAAYESVAGPLDRGLLAAYRAHKRLAKALRSARALRPDGDVRAWRHLRRALAACRETP